MVRSLDALGHGRVNPLVPAAVAIVGLIAVGVGYRYAGAGIVVGAILGYVNGIALSRRVDVAAGVGDVGRALLIMQLGLLLMCTVIAGVAIILIRISLTLAMAAIASFAVTHLAELATFYWTRARVSDVTEVKAS